MTTTATSTVFTTTGAELLRALTATKVAAAPRPSLPCLAGTLIETTHDQTTLTQYNYTAMVRVDLHTPNARPGQRLLIHHARLINTLHALRSTTTPKVADAAPVSLTLNEDGHPTLACLGYTMPLEEMPVEDYPTLPTVPEVVARVAATDYIDALNRVAPSACTDDTLPMLCGVHLHINEDGTAHMQATDRYRIAQAPIPTTGIAVPGSYNLPASDLTGLSKHIRTGTEMAVLASEPSLPGVDRLIYGGISADGITYLTQLLAGKLPNLDALMNSAVTTGTITVETKTLLKAVKAAAKLTCSATDHSAAAAPVELWAHPNGVEVAPQVATDGARATAPVHAGKVSGQVHPHRLVNAKFLAEGLRAVGSDRVSLHHSAKRVLTLTAADTPACEGNFRYTLMSMRTGG